MRRWSELKYLVRKLNRWRAESELQEEIRANLELETQERINDGLSQKEALYAAKRAFGSVALATENSRAGWGFRVLEELWQDLHYGARSVWRKKPHSEAES
jgi:hypothetical protein